MPKSLKIAVMMTSVAAMIATAEVTTWLMGQGLDPRLFLQLLQETGSSASASRMEQFFRRHISHGGMLRNSKKDLAQALGVASEGKFDLPFMTLAGQIQQQAIDKGFEKMNTPAAIGKLYEETTGVDIGAAVIPDSARHRKKLSEPKIVRLKLSY